MPERIIDSVFGPLKFDVFWEGTTSLPGLGDDLPLMIETGNGPPSAEQRRAFQAFVEIHEELVPAIETAILEYYASVQDIYCAAIGPDCADLLAPELEEPSDLWRLLSHPGIFIPVQNEGDNNVYLHWECTWDVEHGLRVEVQQGAVVGVGLQV